MSADTSVILPSRTGADSPGAGDIEAGAPPGLVWAFRFHEDGSPEAIPLDQPLDRRHDGWLWLHFNLADARSVRWLKAAKLPPEAVASLLKHGAHQQLHSVDGCVYGVFADLVRQLDGAGDDIAHLHFVMTDGLLVSDRHHALTAVEAVHDAIKRGEHRLPDAAALLELIVRQVADAFDGVTDKLSRELDEVEEGVALNASRDERTRLGRVRRMGMRLHRQLTGLRAAFHRLEREGSEGLAGKGLAAPLRLVADRLAQRLDSLDHAVLDMQGRARMLQEEVGNTLAEATNRHLHALSALTTLLLPPTFVTGIYGMNVKGIPFTEMDNGFPWVVALMLGSAAAVYFIMRRLGIFS